MLLPLLSEESQQDTLVLVMLLCYVYMYNISPSWQVLVRGRLLSREPHPVWNVELFDLSWFSDSLETSYIGHTKLLMVRIHPTIYYYHHHPAVVIIASD
jgi:hypothetical protein